MGKKKKAEDLKLKTSVKSYQDGIEAEKDSMDAYAKKMGTSVKFLRNQFKAHSKDLQAASLEMKEEGIKRMSGKVNKFKTEIKEEGIKRMSGKVNKFKTEIRDQIKENKEALTHMESGVKLLINEIKGKKRDYQTYIRTFWG